MTIYRVTGDGARRGLGSGDVRAVDEPGSAYSVAAASGGQSAGGSASPVALVALAAVAAVAWAGSAIAGATATADAAAAQSWGGTASVSVQGGVTGGQVWGGAASPVALAPAAAASASSWDGSAQPTASVPASALGAQAWSGTAGPAALAQATAAAAQAWSGAAEPAQQVTTSAEVLQAWSGTAAPAFIAYKALSASGLQGYSCTATGVRHNTAAGWRTRWVSVYDARQELLNAIDEANRNLAEEAREQGVANAEAIVQTNTRVTNVEGRVDTESSRVTALTATVAGKADGSALNALSTRVTATEGAIVSQSDALTALQSQVVGGDNLVIANSSLDDASPGDASRAYGWAIGSTGSGLAYALVASSLPLSTRAQRVQAALTSSQYVQVSNLTTEGNTVRAQPGRRYALSADVGMLGGGVCFLYVQFLNSSGGVLATATSVPFNLGDAFTRRALVTDAAPAGTASAAILLRLFGLDGVQRIAWLAVDNVQFQEGSAATAYAPSTYAASTATQALNTRVTANEQGLDSQASALTALASTVSGKADAGAVTSLSTRVTQTEQGLDTQAGALTALTSTVAGKADASALNSLSTRVTQTEQGLDSQSQAITQVSAQAGAAVTATQTLEARATTLENGQTALRAIHGVYLDVNGKISGTRSINDGTISSFEVLADVFRVISSGMSGFEVMGGYQRNYSSGAQLVMGHDFGSGDLILWYGPNIGAAACTKQNATIWFDKAGSAYFGGTLSAGVLKNAAQSTQVSTVASVETGPFASNGGARVVTYSLLYSNNGTVQTSGAAGTSGPTGATVTLQRSVNGGPWTNLTSFAAAGEKTVNFEPEFGYRVQVTCGGSATFTDNSGGTGPINYRAVVSGATGPWPWINGQGNPGQQSLTVMSVEQ